MGVGWGREIWSNPGRLPRRRSKADKRRNPRSVKVFQMMILFLQDMGLTVSMEMSARPHPLPKVMEMWLP